MRCTNPNCGSTRLSWGVAYNSNSNAGDGRLTMRDVSAVFYLGCDECSETIKTVDTDYVLDLMNVWANTYENED